MQMHSVREDELSSVAHKVGQWTSDSSADIGQGGPHNELEQGLIGPSLVRVGYDCSFKLKALCHGKLFRVMGRGYSCTRQCGSHMYFCKHAWALQYSIGICSLPQYRQARRLIAQKKTQRFEREKAFSMKGKHFGRTMKWYVMYMPLASLSTASCHTCVLGRGCCVSTMFMFKVLEELLPRETGRERRIEKKKIRSELRKEREVSPGEMTTTCGCIVHAHLVVILSNSVYPIKS